MSVETPAEDTGTPDPSATDETGPDKDEAATAEPAEDSTESATDAGDDDTLGEGGKAAIRAEREKARQAHEARKQAEAELDKLRANLAERDGALEALQAEAADAVTLRAILANGLTLADADLIGTGTPEEVDARAKALADRLATATPAHLPPDPTQGLGTAPPNQLTRAERFAEAVRNAGRK